MDNFGEAIVVDTSDDRRRVVVTTSNQRREGGPDSAMDFANSLRLNHGPAVEDFASAVEQAARNCVASVAVRYN